MLHSVSSKDQLGQGYSLNLAHSSFFPTDFSFPFWIFPHAVFLCIFAIFFCLNPWGLRCLFTRI
uniref:Uncharacterized protein n=1 Tax=Arundo donax TaxID=35708 RepID=A0A0A9EFQ8_ARUDO